MVTDAHAPSDMEAAFLTDVCEHPADDAPRLIMADWLEENGQPERGEFVRVQCELAGLMRPESSSNDVRRTALRRRERELFAAIADSAMHAGVPFGAGAWPWPVSGWSPNRLNFGDAEARWGGVRRGFVARVALTLRDWYGEACGRCEGQSVGKLLVCPTCDNRGRVGGHGPALVKAAPLVTVWLSDRRPQDYHNNGGPRQYGWFDVSRAVGDDGRTSPHTIPEGVWLAVAARSDAVIRGGWADFPTEAAALDALSGVLLSWAKGANAKGARPRQPRPR